MQDSDSDFTQRLVAILAADCAGYSRLASQGERATVAALFQHDLEGLRKARWTG